MKIVLPLFLAAAIFSISPAHATELADPSSGCTLTIPDNWEIIPFKEQGGYSIASRSPDKTEGISLYVTPTQAKTVDDATEYINGFESYLKQQKAAIAKSEKEVVGGNTFFVIVTNPAGANSNMTMTALITVAKGNIYQIGLTETDPAKVGDLTTALRSFQIRK